MCTSSVRRPSTGYDSFDEFTDHSTTNRQPYWFTPLLRPGSTIAICCWPEHQSLLPTSCSGSWMLQRELWAARRSTTTAWHTCFTLCCIGLMSRPNITRLSSLKGKEMDVSKINYYLYSTIKTEETEALVRQRAKPSKIKARYSRCDLS